MKLKIKELLEEMLRYLEKPAFEEGLQYLKKADELMKSDDGIYHFVARLTNWLDPLMLKLPDADPNKIKLRGNEGIDYDSYIKGMTNFFKYCPELESIFDLKDEVIYFNSKLSIKEQKEIREFIDENSKREVTNFYIPVKREDKE